MLIPPGIFCFLQTAIENDPANLTGEHPQQHESYHVESFLDNDQPDWHEDDQFDWGIDREITDASQEDGWSNNCFDWRYQGECGTPHVEQSVHTVMMECVGQSHDQFVSMVKTVQVGPS